MKFMEETSGEGMEVELKYCERCGGLFLRRVQTVGVHCASCRVQLTAIPTSSDLPRQTRSRKTCLPVVKKTSESRAGNRQGQTPSELSRIENLCGAAAMEVWA
jgi:hypothetical protein